MEQELQNKLPVGTGQVAEITTAAEGKRRAKKVVSVSFGKFCTSDPVTPWHSAEGLVLTMLPPLPVPIHRNARRG